MTDSEYAHKKFGWRAHKRKRTECAIEAALPAVGKENVPPLHAQQEDKTQVPAAKRRQTKSLFRPWLSEQQNNNNHSRRISEATTSLPLLVRPHIVQYHANMVRCYPPKERSPKEQLRRFRNTLACLRNRRTKRAKEQQLEQQYLAYYQQQCGVLEESVRAALYLKHLMQLPPASCLQPVSSALLPNSPHPHNNNSCLQ